MLTSDILRKLWPKASDALIADTAARADAVFKKYNLNTPLRVAHFMAQISHESGGGTVTEENLNYTSAARIAQVWPSRFTQETAQAFVRNPRLLGNKVYNGRMGNRPNTDDGYNYRGRGFLQLTGRESYERLGKQLGWNLVGDPALVNAYDKRLEVAVAEFVNLKCLPACDADDIRTVTKRVNGGYIGIDSRRAWLAKWKLALPGLPGDVPTEEETTEMDQPLPREADGDKPSTTPIQSKTLWSVLAQIGTTIGAALSALAGLDWKVIAALGGVVVILALFIGRERIQKILEDHV